MSKPYKFLGMHDASKVHSLTDTFAQIVFAQLRSLQAVWESITSLRHNCEPFGEITV